MRGSREVDRGLMQTDRYKKRTQTSGTLSKMFTSSTGIRRGDTQRPWMATTHNDGEESEEDTFSLEEIQRPVLCQTTSTKTFHQMYESSYTEPQTTAHFVSNLKCQNKM